MIVVLAIGCGFLLWNLFGKFKPAEVTSKDMNQPPMTIDTSTSYSAILHTDKGDITIALDSKNAPVTVNNFVYLSKKGLYDKTIFHRVIKGFMIQGGDPDGNGTGGPGYTFADENLGGDYKRGIVAMANSGPNTNGSQFFIMHKDTDMDKLYVIFGKVTKGMDVVDTIATATVHPSGSGEDSDPDEPVHITSIEVSVGSRTQ